MRFDWSSLILHLLTESQLPTRIARIYGSAAVRSSSMSSAVALSVVGVPDASEVDWVDDTTRNNRPHVLWALVARRQVQASEAVSVEDSAIAAASVAAEEVAEEVASVVEVEDTAASDTVVVQTAHPPVLAPVAGSEAAVATTIVAREAVAETMPTTSHFHREEIVAEAATVTATVTTTAVRSAHSKVGTTIHDRDVATEGSTETGKIPQTNHTKISG